MLRPFAAFTPGWSAGEFGAASLCRGAVYADQLGASSRRIPTVRLERAWCPLRALSRLARDIRPWQAVVAVGVEVHLLASRYSSATLFWCALNSQLSTGLLRCAASAERRLTGTGVRCFRASVSLLGCMCARRPAVARGQCLIAVWLDMSRVELAERREKSSSA